MAKHGAEEISFFTVLQEMNLDIKNVYGYFISKLNVHKKIKMLLYVLLWFISYEENIPKICPCEAILVKTVVIMMMLTIICT